MDNNQLLEELEKIVGEVKAKKLIKLTSNYDKYLHKFKKEMNDILNSVGYEVKTGFIIEPINKEE